MAAITGGTVTGSGGAGAFSSGRTVTVSNFKIAKYETTYELWKGVYDWAVLSGYTYAHVGREGDPYEGGQDAGKGTDSGS
ncbi:MAG: hypothetical protein LBD20_07310 [Spirochaetaceae bacterium]|jgi:hypothetical protein|nr:hypothetical protein [Spirochaetaceae bacterium]